LCHAKCILGAPNTFTNPQNVGKVEMTNLKVQKNDLFYYVFPYKISRNFHSWTVQLPNTVSAVVHTDTIIISFL